MSNGAARLQDWLKTAALPVWQDAGVDPDGGFVEQLDLSGRPQPDVTRRIRVQARQIYVFAHATHLGLGDWRGLITRGVEWLTDHGWDRDEGGFHHKLDAGGQPVSMLKDTYDHAFILLGLTWAHRVTGEAGIADWVAKTLDYLNTDLLCDTGSGYAEGVPASLPRRQNPHMHLLEAFLALHEATQDTAHLAQAKRLAGLFHDYFFHAPTGSLTEFFTEDWHPDPERGAIVEPGHHFEWVFLLNDLAARTGEVLPDAAVTLFETAQRHGLDPTSGLAYDEIWQDGSVKTATKRCWPQTEAIRAYALMAERGAVSRQEAAAWIDRLFDHYLSPAPTGTWLDVMGADHQPIAKAIPASTLYHLFTAYAALAAGRVARTAAASA